MTTKKKKYSHVPQLSLHDLINAISYWGSAARLCLIGFIALAVFVLQILDSQVAPATMSLLAAVSDQLQIIVYTIGSFLLLDVGYVMIAKRYSFSALQDKTALIGSEILLGICYFLPYFAVVPDKFTNLTRYIAVAVIAILWIRIFAGMRYGKVGKK